MTNKIRKAVFPVGGLGTRFLPATKSMPKEMLPVYSKPLIQYAFEEAKQAGIEQFIFIIGRNKNTIANHFDHSYELQSRLSESEKKLELSLTKDWLPSAGQIAFVRQQEPLGLGHAIWCARNFIGNDEPFAVLLADEMLKEEQGFLKKMCKLHEEKQANIIAVADIEPHLSHNYGIIEPSGDDGLVVAIKDMIEKPAKLDAKSNISISGRYILYPEIFEHLSKCEKGAGGEVQLTDAMRKMVRENNFYGLRCTTPRFDCGKPLGFLEANIAYAMDDANMAPKIKEMLKRYI
jgi:UTP--glucose-1-phosphate uridylyltransferase